MKPSDLKTASARRKLHRRYTPFVFAFYMALIMGLLMSATIVAVHSGFDSGYWLNVLRAYLLATPVAFCCVIVVRPFVMRLVALTVNI
ncbi:DUF2798 domain-containing protein [Pollutimonas bauzanensis]|uniref:DUF2798 domain-containing protein n=1 Tax=Pollutimonas bauzanensis TaxID=658167 RepID=A0A1M5UK11_9BURK|nr:DUF2798 domain-containing protein [Pollutimonas bauzanensis]SHH63261.1 Protein of unknown function [Pollutimonas bauzanensis]